MFFSVDKFIEIFSKVSVRYFMVAGLIFLLFYYLLRPRIARFKIQLAFPATKDYLREVMYSFSSMVIFAVIVTAVVFDPAVRPFTTIYKEIADFGWAYYVLAFPIMFVMHDTYFYWIHRIMHHPSLFKWFHLVHHKSTNPSPWAAYAFHPLEAILENGIILIFYFTLPMHVSHVPIFFFFSIVYNIYGHLGWELYPKGFSRTAIGRWVNTSVAHNQHHKYFKGNYGLYLLFWDRVMGTLRTDYDDAFDLVKNRKA
jgi:sterol desaturase/sphingolipid hydroxylase (fatty acid hydroxylase superfamily)